MPKDHKYTVVTSHGDVHLKTPNHHTAYDSVETFLRNHKETVTTAIGVAGVAVQLTGLYLGHGRSGAKLK